MTTTRRDTQKSWWDWVLDTFIVGSNLVIVVAVVLWLVA